MFLRIISVIVCNLLEFLSRYATFCKLAGVDPQDDVYMNGSVRSIDSVNVWPMLTGVNLTQPRSLTLTTETSIVEANNTGLILKNAKLTLPSIHLLCMKISGGSWSILLGSLCITAQTQPKLRALTLVSKRVKRIRRNLDELTQ